MCKYMCICFLYVLFPFPNFIISQAAAPLVCVFLSVLLKLEIPRDMFIVSGSFLISVSSRSFPFFIIANNNAYLLANNEIIFTCDALPIFACN